MFVIQPNQLLSGDKGQGLTKICKIGKVGLFSLNAFTNPYMVVFSFNFAICNVPLRGEEMEILH